MVIPTYDDAGFYMYYYYISLFSGIGCVFNPANIIHPCVICRTTHNPIFFSSLYTHMRLYTIYSQLQPQHIYARHERRDQNENVLPPSSQIHPFRQFYRKNTEFLYVSTLHGRLLNTTHNKIRIYIYMCTIFPFFGKNIK